MKALPTPKQVDRTRALMSAESLRRCMRAFGATAEEAAEAFRQAGRIMAEVAAKPQKGDT